MYLTLLDVA